MYERIVSWIFTLLALILIVTIGFQMVSCTEEQRESRERSGTVLPMGAVGRVEVKQVQPFRLLARDIVDEDLSRQHEMDVALARVVTKRGFGRIIPMVIELPDTGWKAGDTRRVTYALPLPQDQDLRISGLANYYMTSHESRPTLSLAVEGPYTWETFGPAMEQLRQWMKDNDTVPTGRPRILLYDMHSFAPEDWKKAEIQIPVR